MAIAYDNSTKTVSGGGSTSLVYSHTTTGVDRFLVVDVALIGSGVTCNTVTYAGQSMTKVTSAVESGTGNESSSWYIKSPTSGVNNVSITTSSASTIYSVATSYLGVDQMSPLDAQASTTSASGQNSVTASPTVVAAGCWVHGSAFLCNNSVPSTSVTSNKTDRQTLTSATIFLVASDSNAIVATGSNSTTWTRSPTGGFANWVGISFSFKPSQSGGSFLLRMI